MLVSITKEFFEEHKKHLTKKPFAFAREFEWTKVQDLYLHALEVKDLELLRDLAARSTGIKGAKLLWKELNAFLEIKNNPSKIATKGVRSLREFADLLTQYIKPTKRKHIYKRIASGTSAVMVPYYVSQIKYHPAEKMRGYEREAYVDMIGHYYDFGILRSVSWSFYASDVIGQNIVEVLHAQKLNRESDSLRGDYEADLDVYLAYKDKIGKQFLAVGFADDEGIDGNDTKRDEWWYSSRYTSLLLDQNGEPARIVIDIFEEEPSDRKRRERIDFPSDYFWKTAPSINGESDDEEDYVDVEELPLTERMEVPVHCYLAVFDLVRHKRLRVHAGNIQPYRYDKTIRERLVLPEKNSRLIDTLLAEQKSAFRDVVKGKAGGTIILCQGSPGTGKTLTAEIYAEATERPLYTVQCSQLGVEPEELESNLMKVLARGKRWNAVMLLDEADVYVHHRGTDLQQNAIVGVFLRVLEYHAGVLFLTTNRGDLVDDAILSRCTARIPYKLPTVDQQKKIWKVIAEANEIDLSPKAIDKIVNAHPKLSGRDIKNLLKLASISGGGDDITPDLITEVKQFKPTCEEFETDSKDRRD